MLLRFPPDVLYLVTSHLQVEDAIRLKQTCRALRQFASSRIFWLPIANALLTHRPLPLPSAFRTLKSLSASELQHAVIKAHRVERAWTHPHPSAHPRTIHLPSSFNIRWVFVLPGTRYMLAYSQDAVLICWDLQEDQPIARFTREDPRERVSCWDNQIDAEGAKCILLVATVDHKHDGKHAQDLELLKLQFDQEERSADFSIVTRLPMQTCYANNFIHGQYAGSVQLVGESQMVMIYLLDYVNNKQVTIDTGFFVLHEDGDLETIARRQGITIFAEGGQGIITATYDFDTLVPHLAPLSSPQSSEPVLLPPNSFSRLPVKSDPTSHNDEWFIMTSRAWDRTISVGPSQPETGYPLSIMGVSRHSEDPLLDVEWPSTTVSHHFFAQDDVHRYETNPTSDLPAQPSRRVKFRPFVATGQAINMPEGRPPIVALGAFGKHAVWLTMDTAGKCKMSLATFRTEGEEAALSKDRPDAHGGDAGDTTVQLDLVELDLQGLPNGLDEIRAVDLDDAAGILTVALHQTLYLYSFA